MSNLNRGAGTRSVVPPSSGVSAPSQDASRRYAGTQYEQMISSNPYENYEYQDSWWDAVGDVLNFRTRQDKYREDMALASREYISQVDSLAREEAYNSESAKVNRMKEAGLNPDLMGIDSASQASEFSEPENSPYSPEGGEGAEKIASLSSTIFNGFQMAVGLFQSLSSLRGTKLTNIGQDIQNRSDMTDYVSSVLLDALDPRGPGFEYRTSSDGQWLFTSEGSLADLQEKYGSDNVKEHAYIDEDKLNNIKFPTRKESRLYKETLARVMSGLPQNSKEFKEYYNREFYRRGYFQKRGSEFFADDDSEMQMLIQPFAEALDKLSRMDLDVGLAKGANDLAYEESFDPNALAQAENAENSATSELKETETKINSVWNDISDYFSKLKETNPVIGSIGLLVVGFLRAQSLQVHATRRTTTKTAPNGEVTSYDRNQLTVH